MIYDEKEPLPITKFTSSVYYVCIMSLPSFIKIKMRKEEMEDDSFLFGRDECYKRAGKIIKTGKFTTSYFILCP